MDPHTGSSASGAGPKKDKKSKKHYEDGEGKKKFVSIPTESKCFAVDDLFVRSNQLSPYLSLLSPPEAVHQLSIGLHVSLCKLLRFVSTDTTDTFQYMRK
ncbi:putative protein diaphanous -like 1 [Scophthalmus maximus]|uniref:Uncharacterized protein n=1 Tax=Scophthalmus maximus TaxID=52904 RepID=A0A2U9CAT3_SCOMX|nr:putative protein diaphanous -like 1 [Scophthalmus maximus]